MVVGCGKIGSLIDEGRGGEAPVTHAGSYVAHDGFNLEACIEPDESRRKAFMKHWGVPHGFADFRSFAESGVAVDVVSLCAPSEKHVDFLDQFLGVPVKLMFCEKPLTVRLDDSRKIAAAYEKAGIPLAVNYTRRWNPSLIKLRDQILDGKWGRLISGSGFYTKGILNNGSHLIDLLHFLFGAIEPVAVTGARTDDRKEDPTLDAVLRTGDGARVHIVGGDARAFYLFELTLVMELGVISLENAGAVLRTRPCVAGPLGQRELGSAESAETAWREQFLGALSNIHDAVAQGAPLLSDAKTAVAAHAVCADLMSRAEFLPPGTN